MSNTECVETSQTSQDTRSTSEEQSIRVMAGSCSEPEQEVQRCPENESLLCLIENLPSSQRRSFFNELKVKFCSELFPAKKRKMYMFVNKNFETNDGTVGIYCTHSKEEALEGLNKATNLGFTLDHFYKEDLCEDYFFTLCTNNSPLPPVGISDSPTCETETTAATSLTNGTCEGDSPTCSEVVTETFTEEAALQVDGE